MNEPSSSCEVSTPSAERKTGSRVLRFQPDFQWQHVRAAEYKGSSARGHPPRRARHAALAGHPNGVSQSTCTTTAAWAILISLCSCSGGLAMRGGAILHRYGLGSWQRGREVILEKTLAALQVPVYMTIH